MRRVKKEKEADPAGQLTGRLIMSMASEMAAAKRSTERACIIFQALALENGVNVANAFEDAH